MLDFNYTGLDQAGNKVSGVRAASSAEELAATLSVENILPLEISELKTNKKSSFSFHQSKKVKPSDLQLFCRQSYTLLKAGIPVSIAIQRLSETANDPYFSEVLKEVLKVLNQGYTLVYAFSKHPKVFPDLFLNIVQIGEDTGQLDLIFLKLSDYMTLEIETKKKMKGALRYPIIVLSTTLISLLIINAFVIPSFAKMFSMAKGELPLPTRMLIASSDFLINCWPYMIGVILVAIFAFKTYVKTPEGKRKWHYFILKIPLTGSIIYRMYLSRFCRLYALMLRSGIPAVESIILVGQATGNAYIAKKILSISEQVARGSTISSACFQTKLFTPLVTQMLVLGEETGKMDDMLDDVSDFYDKEVDFDLEKLSEMIEPILMVVMAVMVLILALGVFLPMWDMASLQGKG